MSPLNNTALFVIRHTTKTKQQLLNTRDLAFHLFSFFLCNVFSFILFKIKISYEVNFSGFPSLYSYHELFLLFTKSIGYRL